MSDEYLWDRSGPPDAEVERLERVLGALGYKAEVQERPVARPPAPLWLAAAAVVLAAVGLSRVEVPARLTPWQVSRMEGASRMGSRAAAPFMALRTGDLLRTGAGAELSLQADAVGQIDLGANSELRASTDRKMRLERGQLHAFIWARPREFVVDTPSARAVDLGCEYTINVDGSGNGLIRVEMGWVAFQYGGHESFIPAHAACVTTRKHGPGIPYYEDAPEAFRRALAAFEQGDLGVLPAILQAARSEDALTVWHLITRVPTNEVGAVYDRFAQLVHVPADVDREAVLRRDAKAIDRCWDALDLQNTEWWRGWERRWQ